MPVFPGSESPLVKSACSIEQEGFNELIIHFSTHTGTHIDVPFHLKSDGLSISDLPADTFMGKAFCLKSSEEKTFSLEEFEKKVLLYGIPDFVLFHTGWDKYWGSEKYFADFPLPSRELIDIITGLKIKGVGIDAISIDPVISKELENHHLLFAAGYIIIENLSRLDKITESVFDLYCFPLKISNADGSPVRAIAHLN